MLAKSFRKISTAAAKDWFKNSWCRYIKHYVGVASG